MNKDKILKRLETLAKETQECFSYNIVTYLHGYTSNKRTEYAISSSLNGFKVIIKESEEEIIEIMNLVEHQVSLLIQAKEAQKRIDTKLIGSKSLIEEGLDNE